MKAYKPKKRLETSYESDDFSTLPKQVAHELSNQSKLGGEDFINQLLGLGAMDNHEEPDKTNMPQTIEKTKKEKTPLKPKNIIFEFKKQLLGETEDTKRESKKENHNSPGLEYRSEIMGSSEKALSRENMELKKQIEQIMHEIKKLVNSTKTLQAEFGTVNVQEAPAQPGKYYVNFFEWMFIMIRQARQKVEDSNTWLDTLQSRSKKMGYWGKAKKYGTSFTQANERNVATSTG